MNCPICKSSMIGRKKRQLLEKVKYFNKKKYKCFDCKNIFFRYV